MDADTWDAMALAGGTRARPMTLGISTECEDDDENLMATLVAHGREGDDDDFYFVEYTAPPGCEIDDREAWAAANPMLGDTLDVDHLAAMVRTTREGQFRRYHLNQRVRVEGAWLPDGAWALCADPRPIRDGARVVLGLDGSFSQDCTALVVVSVEAVPHIDVVQLWEPPLLDPSYRVPVADVEQAIREACRRWDVREIAADPFRWTRTLQALDAERLPVVEFPQSPQRMTPATTAMYEAVVNRQVTQSGDLRLARHVANSVVKEDARGTRLSKGTSAARRIDLAVAAVMAYDRARQKRSGDYDILQSIW